MIFTRGASSTPQQRIHFFLFGSLFSLYKSGSETGPSPKKLMKLTSVYLPGLPTRPNFHCLNSAKRSHGRKTYGRPHCEPSLIQPVGRGTKPVSPPPPFFQSPFSFHTSCLKGDLRKNPNPQVNGQTFQYPDTYERVYLSVSRLGGQPAITEGWESELKNATGILTASKQSLKVCWLETLFGN